ncbi:MAG: DNA polymerase III subunit delta', partial [Gammaproteobacteria bacterium]
AENCLEQFQRISMDGGYAENCLEQFQCIIHYSLFIAFMIYPWQQTQWQKITQLLKTERLPHAMLLHGNQGLGKADFAVALANAVLCQQPTADHQACGLCRACLLLAAHTHPDLHYLKPTAAATSKSKNPVRSIRIDEIRVLCEKLNQTSQYGGFRVAVIDQAELLTLSAANSLLKTLEEPGQNVLILLVVSRTHRLPVTIRSRCQLIRFTVPDEGQALHWLKHDQQPGLSDSQLQQSLKYASGSPLAAIDYLQQAEHQEVLCEAMTASVSGKNSLDYAAKLAKFPKTRTLENMMSWVSDLSRLQSCGAETEITNEQYRIKLQSLAKKVNKQRLYQFYDQLNFNLLHSSIAVNEQLLWESLLISWDNL